MDHFISLKICIRCGLKHNQLAYCRNHCNYLKISRHCQSTPTLFLAPSKSRLIINTSSDLLSSTETFSIRKGRRKKKYFSIKMSSNFVHKVDLVPFASATRNKRQPRSRQAVTESPKRKKKFFRLFLAFAARRKKI